MPDDVVRPQWTAKVQEHQQRHLDAMASEAGTSMLALEQQLAQHFKQLLGPCEIRIRTWERSLQMLIDGEGLPTAFATGPTPERDQPYLAKRALLEHLMFESCSADTQDASGRPTYGYFYDRDEPPVGEPSADPRGMLASYGPIVLVAVPEVVVDATFTLGDTYMRTDQGTRPTLAPAQPTSPHHLPHDHSLSDARAIGRPTDLLTPTGAGDRAWEYIEGQMHTTIRLPDIHRVVFLHDPKRDDTALDARVSRFAPDLEAAGIPWERAR